MSKKQKDAAKCNPWIKHVKKTAKILGITYAQALKDPRTSQTYRQCEMGIRSQLIASEVPPYRTEIVPEARYGRYRM